MCIFCCCCCFSSQYSLCLTHSAGAGAGVAFLFHLLYFCSLFLNILSCCRHFRIICLSAYRYYCYFVINLNFISACSVRACLFAEKVYSNWHACAPLHQHMPIHRAQMKFTLQRKIGEAKHNKFTNKININKYRNFGIGFPFSWGFLNFVRLFTRTTIQLHFTCLHPIMQIYFIFFCCCWFCFEVILICLS